MIYRQMGSSRFAGLGVLIVIFQASTLVIAKEPPPACIPHFKADNQTFIVPRRQLLPGYKLGRVSFDDCFGWIKLHFRTSAKQFSIHSDGMLKSTNEMHMPVLHFPISNKGLKRSKRDWVIPPIRITENSRGPFPDPVAPLKSNRDKEDIILYSISGPGADGSPFNLFSMGERSGVLSVLQPLDREVQDRYHLTAKAELQSGGPAEEPMDIIVYVIDQNDNKPFFIKDTFRGEVPEASPKGYVVVTVEATDADDKSTPHADVRYSIISQTPEEPAGLFFINAVSGAILLNVARALDRETHPEYTLEVQAADMEGDGLTAKAKVIITVTDSNDNAPVFTQSSVSTSQK